MIYVDQIMIYPGAAIKPGARRNGTRWAHLWADKTVELHAFAKTIGLQASWFQNRPHFPHYDLVPSFRDRALRAGAQETSIQRWLNDRRAALSAERDALLGILAPYAALLEPGDICSLAQFLDLVCREGLALRRLTEIEYAMIEHFDGVVTLPPGRGLNVTLYPDFGEKEVA